MHQKIGGASKYLTKATRLLALETATPSVASHLCLIILKEDRILSKESTIVFRYCKGEFYKDLFVLSWKGADIVSDFKTSLSNTPHCLVATLNAFQVHSASLQNNRNALLNN